MKNVLSYLNDENKIKTNPQPNPLLLKVSKKILARQSIFRNIDCNMPHEIKKKNRFVTQQQIKTSLIYQKVLQRIQKAKRKEWQQKQQFAKRMDWMNGQIQQVKQQTKECKVEMWEMRNEMLQLEQMLKQECQQYEQLYNEIRSTQQEEGYNQEQESQQLVESEETESFNLPYQTQNSYSFQSCDINTASEQDPSPDQEESISKPTCSIKYFISNRSITTSNLSKQMLSVGEGIRLFTQSDNQHFTQLYVRDQQAQQQTENSSTNQAQNFLSGLIPSFKKTQKPIFQDN